MLPKILQIFAKAPVLGKVKTRLAVDVGEQRACELYTRLLINTVKACCCEQWKVELWCAPNTQHLVFKALAEQYDVTLKTQQGEGLGGRMLHALSDGKKRADKVVLIGADSPVISAAYIEQAFESLMANDVVFGPVEDGGYILVGAGKVAPAMFSDVEWSVDNTLNQNISSIERCGLSCSILPKLWDVDVLEDLQRWQRLELSS